MKDFLRNLQFIFRPKFWGMNRQYDKDWDVEFNRLLDEHTFSGIGECTAKLGDTKIWITNYPYASFSLPRPFLSPSFVSSSRPSRLTILRAKKQFDRDKLRLQILGCVYPPRSQRMEELQREIIEIRETLDMLRASNYKNDIMGDTIIKKHKFK